ncbi:MAG TPA: hypothetical protein VFH61_14960 [Thermoleophilia bacterium]|nr:hypothetical protein [Thermoleophilia bacterium]
MTDFKSLPLSQRLFRALMLTILTGSTVYCAFLTYKYITDDRYVGWQATLLVVTVAFTTFSLLAMTADAFDYLMRERHYSLEDVTKLEMVVLVVLGIAFTASAFVVGLKLFMTFAPAVVIYILLVVKPTSVEAQEAMKDSPSKPARATRGRAAPQPVDKRQRRGGRKR